MATAGWRNRLLAMLAILAAAAVAGCTGMNGQQPLNAETLHADQNCGGSQEEASLRIITDGDSFDQAVKWMGRHTVGGEQEIARPEFDDTLAVLIEMGQKPTGGYGVALREHEVTIEGDAAILRLEWAEPAADSAVTLALTSPCALIALPQGDYQRIIGIDQDGNRRVAAER